MNELTHISLFTGIGGFDLAAEWAGFRTIAMCEVDPFCQEVLKARFGAVADASDTRLQGGQRREPHNESGKAASRPTAQRHPLLVPDIRDFDGTRFRGATLLTGGFPCQPFSHAGKREGRNDKQGRHLWPEMLRVIAESRPRWCIAENVPGLISIEDGVVFEQACTDLEGEGYEVQAFIIPACAVNAPHRRDRVWIVAHREGAGLEGREPAWAGCSRGCDTERPDGGVWNNKAESPDSDADHAKCERQPGCSCGATPESHSHGAHNGLPITPDSDAPDAAGGRWEQCLSIGQAENIGDEGNQPNPSWDIPWIEVATDLLRMDDGLSCRMDEYLQGVENAPTIKSLSRQDVRVLREAFQQEEIRNSFGRLWKISDAPFLLNLLCRIEAFANGSGDILPTGARVQESLLRPLWEQAKAGCASRGWRHNEQHRREHEDSLPFLPYEVALEIKEAWGCVRRTQEAISGRRVARLKALGNAIVPAVAYEIIKEIAEIEG